ncbi:hypothetical protein HID58_067853, partial [Brassica napus]
ILTHVRQQRYQIFAQIQRYMFLNILHVCIIEINFRFFLLDLNLHGENDEKIFIGHKMRQKLTTPCSHVVSVLHFFVKALHHEGFGLECVQYAIFDGPTYEWVVISRQPNIIGKLRFCSTSRCMHMVLANIEGEKDIGAVHTSSWGQRRVASTASHLACYSTRAEALQSDYVFDESSGTKEDPQLYYAPTKPLEEGTSEAEQHVGAYILRMEVSHETRSEYQKEIEEPYMGNVEKEQKVANNSKPNSELKDLKSGKHEVLSVHGHVFSSEKQPGSLLEGFTKTQGYIG